MVDTDNSRNPICQTIYQIRFELRMIAGDVVLR